MRRTALVLSLGSFGLALAGGDVAPAATTVISVGGEVRALAVSGNAIVVARQPDGRGLVVERRVPGSPTQVLLRTALEDDDDQVALATSVEALAVGLNGESGDDFGSGRVLAGPAGGPLREVASCPAGLIASPVAVAGPRIAWRDGGCGTPADEPRGVTPSTIVVGGADAGAPVRRLPIAGQGLAASLALGPGDSGIVGTLLPSFFSADTEIRTLGPLGVGAPLAAEQGRQLQVAGLLADGRRVLVLRSLDDDGSEAACASVQVQTVAASSTERRTVPLGDCVVAGAAPGIIGAPVPVAAGDRIATLVGQRRTADVERRDAVSVVSTTGDGGDRRVHARSTWRRAAGVATDGERVGWWQPRCRGGNEIVVQDRADPQSATGAECRLEILTRSARVRDGLIAVRVRCAEGCRGGVVGGGRLLQGIRTFTLGPGTHVLRLRVALGRRRSARLTLRLFIDHGTPRSARITVRR